MRYLALTFLICTSINQAAWVAELQASAVISEVYQLSPIPLAQLFGTMKLLANRDTANGVSISIFSVLDKLGECENSSGLPVGANARTCPRGSILISTTLQLEGASKFKLYKTSSRLEWKLPNAVIPKTIQPHPYHTILLACEASSAIDKGSRDGTDADRWHYVEYELVISDFDKIVLTRLSDTNKYLFCSE